MTTTEAVSYRLALARRVAPAYARSPHVEAMFVFGSVANGFADRHSDIEIAAIWSRPPDDEERRVAAAAAAAGGLKLEPFSESHGACSEEFTLEGVKIEMVHWTRPTIESIIGDVMDRSDVSQGHFVFEKQATVAAILRGVALSGEELLNTWKQKVSPYPRELAVAMVQKHLRFGPFGDREMLAERCEIPLLYENHCHSIRLLVNLLFGLNRIYYPGFKWTRYLVDEMTLIPAQFFNRLERVFHADPVSGTGELRALIEETFDLVGEHLPEVEMQAQRRTFAR